MTAFAVLLVLAALASPNVLGAASQAAAIHSLAQNHVARHTYVDRHSGMRLIAGKIALDHHVGEFQQPSAGKVFFLIHVTIDNGGKRARSFSSADFGVVTQAGIISQATTMLPRAYRQLGKGRLPPHATRKGWVGFIIDVRTKTVSLTWSDGGALNPAAWIASYRLRK